MGFGPEPIGGGEVSGSVAHADTTGQTANDHHNQEHGSADHSGTIGTESQITFDNSSGHDHDGTDSKAISVAHADTTGQTATDHHSNANDPSSDEKAALVGTSGTPSVSNKYVTNDDSRLIALSPFDVMDGRVEYVSSTSIKWAFVKSNQVVLYSNTDSEWKLVELASEPTGANDDETIGEVALTYDANYDVFLKYSSGTAATIAFVPWKTHTARYDAWFTANNYKTGDRKSESGSIYACLETHTSGTFATDLAAGKWIEVDADGLDTLDGRRIYANSGAFREYRYVGCVRLVNDSGAKFKSTANVSFIHNKYNPRLTSVSVENSTSSWTYGTATWRESNGGTGQTRAEVLIGEMVSVSCVLGQALNAGESGSGFANIGVNTTTATSGSHVYTGVDGQANFATPQALQLSLGYNYITTVEQASSTITYRGGSYLNCLVSLLT
jgi:hypothetical protein